MSRDRPVVISPAKVIAPRAAAPSAAVILALLAWLTACSAFVYWRTFTLPYALDDLDQLHELARMRSGQSSFATWLLVPHNEHIVPLLRLLFWLATWVTGLDASAFRCALLLIHIAGAFGCAWLVFLLARDRLASFLAGTVYAGAAGFAGSPVWEPTISVFSISATPLIFAFLIVATPRGLSKRGVIASLALVFVSCTGLPAAGIAALAIPAFLLLAKPAIALNRWRAVTLYVFVALSALPVSRWVLTLHGGAPVVPPRLTGLIGGGWLVLTAPFRFLRACVPMQDPGVPYIAAVSIIVWVVFLLFLRWATRPVFYALTALWAGASLLALLIGLGRSANTLLTLYLTDRYYYYFLLPFSIYTAVIGARVVALVRKTIQIPDLLLATAALMLLGGFFVGSRLRLESTVPWSTYQFHDRAISAGRALVHLIANRASEWDPVTLADGPIPFDGVHKDQIALSSLFFAEFASGRPGVHWNFVRLGAEGASTENQLLDGWAQALGTTSPVCVVDGQLRDVRATSWIDFRKGSFQYAVLRGFHPWERTYRWMTHRGTIRLLRASGDSLVIRASAPLRLLRRKWPSLGGLRASVVVQSIPAGEIYITRPEEQEFQIPLPSAVLSTLGVGQTIDVTLMSELTWRGVDIDSSILDERELSLALVAIGFPPRSLGTESLWLNNCSARVSKQTLP